MCHHLRSLSRQFLVEVVLTIKDPELTVLYQLFAGFQLLSYMITSLFGGFLLLRILMRPQLLTITFSILYHSLQRGALNLSITEVYLSLLKLFLYLPSILTDYFGNDAMHHEGNSSQT